MWMAMGGVSGSALLSQREGVVVMAMSVALLCVTLRRWLFVRRDGDDAVEPLRKFKAELLGRKGEEAVARRIAELELPALHDVVLTDERGPTQIDHIVRTLRGIVVLETKRFSGVLTGAVRDRYWHQRVGGSPMLLGGRGRRWRAKRRVETKAVEARIRNPLHQNYRHVKAVEYVVDDPEVPIRGFVVSAGTARFDGELATAVMPLDALEQVLCSTASIVVDPGRVERAWQRLTESAGPSAKDPRSNGDSSGRGLSVGRPRV